MNLRQQPGVRVLACLVDPKLVFASNPGFPTLTLAMRVSFSLFGISRFASIPPIPLVFDSIPSQP